VGAIPSDLAAKVDCDRQHGNLSSAIRLFVLEFYCSQIDEYEGRVRTREILTKATASTDPKAIPLMEGRLPRLDRPQHGGESDAGGRFVLGSRAHRAGFRD
jgi:hypothetical protein